MSNPIDPVYYLFAKKLLTIFIHLNLLFYIYSLLPNAFKYNLFFFFFFYKHFKYIHSYQQKMHNKAYLNNLLFSPFSSFFYIFFTLFF